MLRFDQIHSRAFSFVILLLTVVLLSAGVARADEPAAKTATPSATKGEPDPNDPQVAAKLEKRQKLLEQLKETRKAKKHAEVVQLLEELLAMERELYGLEHTVVKDRVNTLSDEHETEHDFNSSRRVRQNQLELLTAKFGQGNWQVEDARRALDDVTLRERLTPEQRQSLLEVKGLTLRVNDLSSNGKFREALDTSRKVLEIRKKTLGEEHPQYTQSLNNLAWLYESMSDYAKAEPLRQQVLAIRKKTLGEEHPDYARSLYNLAKLYHSLADYAKAEPLLTQALAISKKVLGEQSVESLDCVSSLADLHYETGGFTKAEPLYLHALELAEKVFGEEHLEYTLRVELLALLYSKRADYAKAEPLYLRAIAIQKKALGEEHPDYAHSLHNLELMYQSLGDYGKAEPLVQQALEIRKKKLGDEHPEYAQSLYELAKLYHSKGDYAKAEPLYQQTIEIQKRGLGEEHPDYASSLNDLGMMYRSLGDYAKAELLYQQALEIYEKLGLDLDSGACVNNLANLYLAKLDFSKAEPLYRQALAIHKKTLGEEHPDYALCLYNLGLLYGLMSDYAQAEPLYQQALEIHRKVLGEEHPDYARILNGLGLMYLSLGDYAQAESLFRQALEIRRKVLGEEHPDYASSLYDLGMMYRSLGDYAQAEPLFRQALEKTSRHLERSSAVMTERQQLAFGQSFAYRLDNYLSCLLQLGEHDAEAYRAVLSWKGATLVRQRAARVAASEPELAPLFAEFQRITRLWAQLATGQLPSDAEQLKQHQARLAKLSEERDALEVELSRKSATYRQGTQKVTLDQLQTSLPDKSALVDYLEFNHSEPSKTEKGTFTYRRSLLAFVVRPGQPVRMFNLGEIAPVQQAISTWRESYGVSSEGEAAGLKLRAVIWEPLQEALKDAETVLISPDGTLGQFPFAALPGKDPQKYLIEEQRLALVPVPQLIPRLTAAAPAQKLEKDLLLMGGIDYDERTLTAATTPTPGASRFRGEVAQVTAGVRWDRLEGAAGEVAFIQSLYTQDLKVPADLVVYRNGGQATEEEFRNQAPHCYVLHLATHGFFAAPDKKSALSETEIAAVEKRSLRANPFGERFDQVQGYSPGLLSGLVFAGANHPPAVSEGGSESGMDDGYLTADEIASLPLNGVKLVVLSACETGLGQVAGGEGLLGLQRGFQVSGAQATIASLWKVNDPATQWLMQRFYTNYLKQGLTPAAALREAQLWAIRHPSDVPRGLKLQQDDQSSQRLPPYYWAPFILSGDFR